MKLSTWMKQIKKDSEDSELAPSRRDGGMQSDPDENVLTDTNDASRWIGFIDRIESGAIHGWAYDTADPEASVVVEAIANSGKARQVLADLFREDVAGAGYGTGKYGFIISLSDLGLNDGSVVVRFAASKHPITLEPIGFEAQHALLTHDMPPTFGRAMILMAERIRSVYDTGCAPDAQPR